VLKSGEQGWIVVSIQRRCTKAVVEPSGALKLVLDADRNESRWPLSILSVSLKHLHCMAQ